MRAHNGRHNQRMDVDSLNTAIALPPWAHGLLMAPSCSARFRGRPDLRAVQKGIIVYAQSESYPGISTPTGRAKNGL
jgi:hypothetical protein